jgi:anti-anti-sigma regulatory factor
MSFRIKKLPEGFMSEKEVRKMRAAVRKELVNGNDRLVVDLGIATHVNSIVIGALVEMYTSYRNNDGSILFARPTPQVRMLLEALRLDRVFEIVSTLTAAADRLDTRKSHEPE